MTQQKMSTIKGKLQSNYATFKQLESFGWLEITFLPQPAALPGCSALTTLLPLPLPPTHCSPLAKYQKAYFDIF